jgi:COMPASS component BRE2
MMLQNKPTLKSHSTPITQRTLPWYAKLLSKDFPTLRGSLMSFYKNGTSQGVAFSDIPAPIPAAAAVPEDHRKPLESFLPEPPVADDGTIGYYPTVSLFCGGSVKLNFGPDFEFPPTDLGEQGVAWRAMCERLGEHEAEVNYSKGPCV